MLECISKLKHGYISKVSVHNNEFNRETVVVISKKINKKILVTKNLMWKTLHGTWLDKNFRKHDNMHSAHGRSLRVRK